MFLQEFRELAVGRFEAGEVLAHNFYVGAEPLYGPLYPGGEGGVYLRGLVALPGGQPPGRTVFVRDLNNAGEDEQLL